jgi:hypothetical protein
MNGTWSARSASVLAIGAILVSSACGSSDGDGHHHRTEPLKTFDGSDPTATHVADFNREVGPQTKTVTIPADSLGALVRFDCVGDGETFRLRLTGFGIASGRSTCDAIGEDVYVLGGAGTVTDPAVRRGDTVRIAVQVEPDVRWSLSVDLTPDEATADRLVNPS